MVEELVQRASLASADLHESALIEGSGLLRPGMHWNTPCRASTTEYEVAASSVTVFPGDCMRLFLSRSTMADRTSDTGAFQTDLAADPLILWQGNFPPTREGGHHETRAVVIIAILGLGSSSAGCGFVGHRADRS